MPSFIRTIFPYAALALILAAIAWSMSFGVLPRADFAFNNGGEVKTVDPAKATGSLEGRIINALFEGLLSQMPKGMQFDDAGNLIRDPIVNPDGNTPMVLVPGMAEALPEISADGREYTFRIRPNVTWSDGSPFTSRDMYWSWRRMLHPETASRYAMLLFYVKGAEQYTKIELKAGDHVEVELPDRIHSNQTFPRGTIQRGMLLEIVKTPAEFAPDANLDEEGKAKAIDEWKQGWVFVVDVKDSVPGESGASDKWDDIRQIDWNKAGTIRRFTKAAAIGDGETRCRWILPDFATTVGLNADDEHVLKITLKNATPYFSELCSFYPMHPVNRRCIETYGSPNWTDQDHIVNNGPFCLQFRRIRDRLRLERNEKYWNAKIVKLNTIDAMAIQSETTSLNLYLDGQLDWSYVVPISIIPTLKETRPDFKVAPGLIVYLYRINTTLPGLNDARVRRALNLAIDKRTLCKTITKAGEIPAETIVPPGIDGYDSPDLAPPEGDLVEVFQRDIGDPHRQQLVQLIDDLQLGPVKEMTADMEMKIKIAAARRLLADAGFPDGRGLPRIEILYNTLDAHSAIAEFIQQQWKTALGVDVKLKNAEWASYLDDVHQLDYRVARGGWIGDYPDPNTFLEMWVSGGENNETGWSNTRYDELITAAGQETNRAKRMEILKQAEALLMQEKPFLPIYFYVTKNMVSPRVHGFTSNIQDEHPLQYLRVEK